MKQKLLYTMLCVTLSMVFLIGNYSKCSLGGTTQEHEILARVRSGEITIEEANNLMNALPDSQRSPDVVAAGNSSNTESSTPATTTKPEPQKAEPKCNHTYTSEVLSEPTCVEKGIRKYTCQSCGNTYTEEIALVDEHDYKEEITKEPTCDETGEKTFTCKDCGKTYTELINNLGHNEEMERTKNPTCTEEGEDTYTCKRCGMMHTESVKAKGHTEGEWNAVTPQGMFSEGLKEKSCADCGEVLTTEVIPSTYPIYYLYVGIGAVLTVIACIVIAVVLVKKRFLLKK